MKISINEPCHENWDQMTPNDRGAFCLSCQKNVVDFSSKSINQIKDFFRKKESSESVCGRFDEQQLDALNFDDFFGRFKSWQFLHKIAVIFFFVFGMGLFANAQSNVKHEVLMGKVAYIPKDTTKKVCRDTTNNKKPMVKGDVKYEPKQSQKKPKNKPMMGEPLIEDKNAK